jgi:Ca2+:H+ antiporter
MYSYDTNFYKGEIYMQKIFLTLVIISLPLAVGAQLMHWGTMITFIICCVGIVGLAFFMGHATESLAIHSGPRIGGLLNATFGNAVELIISIFAIKAGFLVVVLASLTGAVIGNLLLVGGLSLLVGGLRYKRQRINKFDARHNAGLLIFSVFGAFLLPAIFATELESSQELTLSIGISVILILVYLGGLYFKLVSHRGVYNDPNAENHDEKEEAEWTKKKALTILALATVGVAYLSERLVHTIEGVGHSLHWSELFIGIIVVAIVGNAAEHASAIVMAYKNKMDIAMEIAVGSTLQIAMFVAPVLVLLSLFFGKGMALVFTGPELAAMITSVLLMNKIMTDGDTNWLEGVMLLGLYIIMGIGFYLL